jgi:hypothetical protein
MAGCRFSRGLTALLCGLWLAGCGGDAGQSRAWELAGQPGLLLKVQQYYETRGIEEGGRCTAPIMQGVAGSQVLSDDPSQMVIALSYYYRDWVRDGDDCDSLRPGRCMGLMRECRGFAERTFTIDKGQDGLSVAGMSGPQRGQRR